MSEIRDNLLSASKNGNFLEVVDQTSLQQNRDEKQSVGKEIAILHNEGLIDRKSTRLNSSHIRLSRMPSSA